MISAISLAISFTVLLINLYLAWVKQPKLRYAKADNNNELALFFKTPEKLKYPGSTHVACLKIHMYNLSASPVTISEFSLESESGKAFFRSNTSVDYSIELHDEYYLFNDNSMTLPLHGKKVKLPLVMEPYGYHEGYIVFPFIKDFREEDQNVTVRAHTGYKNFPWKVTLKYCDNVTLISK